MQRLQVWTCPGWKQNWIYFLYDKTMYETLINNLQLKLREHLFNQGSHTSQMRKFKGISRVIKGSTAHFQGYFWKNVITLLYVNKISSNFSHLFQDLVWSMQHSKEVSIIFLKNGWWQNSMKFIQEKNISVDLFFVSFTNFKGIQGFYTKFQAISRVQRAKINYRLFKGFKV